MPRLFRMPGEIVQPYPYNLAFTFTTTADIAQDAATLTTRMSEGNKVSIIVENNDAYIDFDRNATTASMLIPAGSGYFDDGIAIETRISIINATAGNNARIRGIVWGR